MMHPPHLVLLVAALHAHAAAFTYRELTSRTLREATSFGDSSVDLPSGEPPRSLPSLFWSRNNARGIFRGGYRCLVLQATTGGDGEKRVTYRFGDLTKSLIGGKVQKITGKPYEFGGEELR